MSFLFPSSKPKTPAVPPPPPTPQLGTDAEDAAMKAARRRSGFKRTLITGDLAPKAQGKTLLGD